MLQCYQAVNEHKTLPRSSLASREWLAVIRRGDALGGSHKLATIVPDYGQLLQLAVLVAQEFPECPREIASPNRAV